MAKKDSNKGFKVVGESMQPGDPGDAKDMSVGGLGYVKTEIPQSEYLRVPSVENDVDSGKLANKNMIDKVSHMDSES